MPKEIRALLKQITVVFFAGAILSPAANAVLVSTGHTSWGVDSITLDTQTGMRWLDINHSLHFSYNEMLAEVLDGGVFEGFRYATQGEVEALAINSGVLDINSSSAANINPALDLMGFFGSTQISRSNPEIFGMTGTVSSGFVGSGVFDHLYSDGIAVYDVGVLGPSYGMDFTSNSVGNWLVSTTEVPLPPAFLLFSSALALLGLLKRNLNRFR
jgi:hypothetical protein